jgi:hypothetical protein
MNWNTKAKTRAGRGRNKDDTENQQRLAAWNKLPKKKINGKAMTAAVAGNNELNIQGEGSYAVTVSRSQFSDDLLMLGSNVPEHESRDIHLKYGPSSSFDSPPKQMLSDDPLSLLELTVKKRRQRLSICRSLHRPFFSFSALIQPEKVGRGGHIRVLNGLGGHENESNC